MRMYRVECLKCGTTFEVEVESKKDLVEISCPSCLALHTDLFFVRLA